MKTVLAVIGGIVLLGIIVVVGGGYWAYTKSGAKVTEMAEVEVEKFIKEKNPGQPAADSLHRILNSAKKQKQPFTALILVGAMGRAIQDDTVSPEEIAVLDEGSQMAESRELTKEDIQAYVARIDQVMPDKNKVKATK